jgi:hypothetical protein
LGRGSRVGGWEIRVRRGGGGEGRGGKKAVNTGMGWMTG